MKRLFHLFLIVVVGAGIWSCSEDNTSAVDTQPPTVSFGEEAIPSVEVKTGQSITIEPTIEHAGDDAIYLWRIDGKIVGRDPFYTYEAGDDPYVFYLGFSVTTAYGTADLEIQVNIVSLRTPDILMAVPEEGFSVISGGELAFTPEVLNSENASFEWTVDGQAVCHTKDYTFSSDKVGIRKVVLTTANEDGTDTLSFDVRVCSPDEMPFEWMWETEVFNLSIGRTAFIRSFWIKNAFDATYTWTVDGVEVQQNDKCLFAYTPDKQGEHLVSVTMKNSYVEQTKEFVVNACAPEGTYKRPLTAASSKDADHGYFFLPAPAQHVNRGSSPRAFSSQEEVNAYVYDHPGSTEYGGSIGAWGGTLVVGFDHSVENSGEYDLEIEGNAFAGWSEPGIVWVMQDENGNGKPDDTWYELKGSEYGKNGYIQDYAVTYYKGSMYKPIVWVDNQGNTGTISYIHEHTPPTLYPRWLDSESYTIVGSCLPAMSEETSPGYWVSHSFEWGYVDNWSEIDMLRNDDNHNASWAGNHFRISDAVTYDGKPANLKYIDFVKIMTGANGTAGGLGEISTEVGGIRDFNMLK